MSPRVLATVSTHVVHRLDKQFTHRSSPCSKFNTALPPLTRLTRPLPCLVWTTLFLGRVAGCHRTIDWRFVHLFALCVTTALTREHQGRSRAFVCFPAAQDSDIVVPTEPIAIMNNVLEAPINDLNDVAGKGCLPKERRCLPTRTGHRGEKIAVGPVILSPAVGATDIL